MAKLKDLLKQKDSEASTCFRVCRYTLFLHLIMLSKFIYNLERDHNLLSRNSIHIFHRAY